MNDQSAELIPLPFFSYRDEGFETWIVRNRDNAVDDKDAFVRYLRQCQCLAAVPGIERDPFNHNRIITDSPNILTDGSWVWVQTLAYWVESLDMLFPEEFINNVRRRRFEAVGDLELAGDANPWRNDPDFFKN